MSALLSFSIPQSCNKLQDWGAFFVYREQCGATALRCFQQALAPKGVS